MDDAIVIDASVMVSWLVSSDAHHKASRLWLEAYRAKGGLLIAPTLMIIEIASAIARPTFQPEVARAAIQRLYSVRTLRLVTLGPALAKAAVNVAIDLRLRAGDTSYVALAKKFQIPLVSWDKEQLFRASSIISAFSPDVYPFS